MWSTGNHNRIVNERTTKNSKAITTTTHRRVPTLFGDSADSIHCYECICTEQMTDYTFARRTHSRTHTDACTTQRNNENEIRNIVCAGRGQHTTKHTEENEEWRVKKKDCEARTVCISTTNCVTNESSGQTTAILCFVLVRKRVQAVANDERSKC